MIEKLKRYSDKLSVKKFVPETIAYRSEEVSKILKKSKRDPDAYRMIFRIGFLLKKILEIIKEEKAVVLVMGTKGRNHLEDVLSGTTAQKNISSKPCNIIEHPYER